MQGNSIKQGEPVIHSTWLRDIEDKVHSFYHDIDQALQSIKNLQDDWDGEGAPGFQEEFTNHVSEFVKQLALRVWQAKQRVIAPPVITPCPDGSLDIHWRTTEFDLLVNVPPEKGEPVSFSADDYHKNVSTGTCDASGSNPVLISWLVAYA